MSYGLIYTPQLMIWPHLASTSQPHTLGFNSKYYVCEHDIQGIAEGAYTNTFHHVKRTRENLTSNHKHTIRVQRY